MIRWTKAQKARLNSAVRSFNAQLRRAQNMPNAAVEHMPTLVSYQELRKKITTGKQLNVIVNSLLRARKMRTKGTEPFAMRMTKSGAKTTNWQYREAVIAHNVREAAKTRERRRRGWEDAEGNLEKGHKGEAKFESLLPSELTPEDYTERGIDTIRRRMYQAAGRDVKSRARAWASNYMRSLRANSLDITNEELYESIEGMVNYISRHYANRINDILLAYEELEIDYNYVETTEEFTQRFTRILNTWQQVAQKLDKNESLFES